MDTCIFVEFDVDRTDDVESAKDGTMRVTEKYDIRTIPHIIVFERQSVITRISGPTRQNLTNMMQEKKLLRTV